MFRLPVILAALIATAAPLGLPEAAQAQERRDRAERRESRGDNDQPRRAQPRSELRDFRDDDDGRGGYPAPRSLRQGGFLPPAYENGRIEDYGRYRLRPPPRGYAWVRVGRSYALVSLSTGQVFEMVPF